MSGSESVKSCLRSKPAELQPSSSPPPVSTSLPLFLAHKASLSINGTNVLTRWLCLGLDRAPPFVFLTDGHQQHHRSHSIFSGHLSASRYFANSPLRPRHPLLITTLSSLCYFRFRPKWSLGSSPARRRFAPPPPARPPPLGPQQYCEPIPELKSRRRGRSRRRRAWEVPRVFVG